MSVKSITFNTEGYDPFIDFIKAYAIICVLIGHTIPLMQYAGYGLWAGMQVPLFILVQCFHYYKRNDSKTDLKKMFYRIILPFVIFSLITFVIYYLTKDEDVKSLFFRGLRNGGGYGPGSYYPIIYLQIALLLPVFRLLFNNVPRWTSLLIFLLLSEGYEIICSIYNPPAWLYRISSFRYLFLIYLGWLWVKEGVKLDWKTILLSILSMLSIIYFEYVSVIFQINNEPLFFETGWAFHRWPCYCYVSIGLLSALHYFYSKIQNKDKIKSCIRILAKSSYEIFLVQMSFCFLFKPEQVPFIDNPYLQFAIRFVLVWVVSIWGGIIVNKIFNRVFNRKPICTEKQSVS